MQWVKVTSASGYSPWRCRHNRRIRGWYRQDLPTACCSGVPQKSGQPTGRAWRLAGEGDRIGGCADGVQGAVHGDIPGFSKEHGHPRLDVQRAGGGDRHVAVMQVIGVDARFRPGVVACQRAALDADGIAQVAAGGQVIQGKASVGVDHIHGVFLVVGELGIGHGQGGAMIQAHAAVFAALQLAVRHGCISVGHVQVTAPAGKPSFGDDHVIEPAAGAGELFRSHDRNPRPATG